MVFNEKAYNKRIRSINFITEHFKYFLLIKQIIIVLDYCFSLRKKCIENQRLFKC